MTAPAPERDPADHGQAGYLSEACLHGEHDACGRTCKFCPLVCTCTRCRHDAPAGDPDQPPEPGVVLT